jgi:hypothetical protein
MNTSFYINYLIHKVKTLTKTDKILANFGFGLIGLIGLVFPFGVYFFFKGNLNGQWTAYFLSSAALFSLGILLFAWIRKRNYERCFYGVILFICSIMLFAFPMAELLYDNDKYLSLSTLREMDGLEDAALYSVDPLPSPELIFDLGEPIKRVKTTQELPQNEVFGLLVNDTLSPLVTREFDTEFKAMFDINNLKEGKSGHKQRKTMKLYLLEKKQ